MKYLRNRPFLVIDVWYRPATNVRTERKGWIAVEANWDIEEAPRMEHRISNNTMATATLIIDVNERALIKNRFHGTAEDKDIVDHFLEKYAPNIQAYLQRNPSLQPTPKVVAGTLTALTI